MSSAEGPLRCDQITRTLWQRREVYLASLSFDSMHTFTNSKRLVQDVRVRYGVVLKFYVFFLCISVTLPPSLNKKETAEEKKKHYSLFYQLVYLVLLNLCFPVTDKWNCLLPLRERDKCPLLIVSCLVRTFPNSRSFILNLYMQKCLKILVSTDLLEYCKYNTRNLLLDIKPVIAIAENKVYRVTLFFQGERCTAWKGTWMVEVKSFWA